MIKRPVFYYGGKTRIAKWILYHAPHHKNYVEPFAGGLGVFFAKNPSKQEVINDLDSFVYNFWKQVRDNNEELARVCKATVYSKEDFDHCQAIKKGEVKASDLERARAFFLLQNARHHAGGGMRRVPSAIGSHAPKLMYRRSIEALRERFSHVYVENEPYQRAIERWDTPKTFFYCDPPYPNANQCYDHKFTVAEFNELVEILDAIQGKFILSYYETKGLKIPSSWTVRRVKAYTVFLDNTKTKNRKLDRVEAIAFKR